MGSTDWSQPPPIVLRPRGVDRGAQPSGTGVLGMRVFLVSLSSLFATSLVGYLVIRLTADRWPPIGAPAIPRGVWISTLLLIGCSAAIQTALVRVRSGQSGGVRRALALTWVLSALFLLNQSASWIAFFDAATFQSHLYGFTFYMLTGLHALHVFGGMIALAVVTYRDFRGAYSWAYYPGIRHCATYWHFLGLVWIVLIAVLLV